MPGVQGAEGCCVLRLTRCRGVLRAAPVFIG